MKIGTFSVVCGTAACNASCPFCVAKMTPDHSLVKPDEVNWRNLEIACRFAKDAGATTALITGKGEPTLYPDLVGLYIEKLERHFPFVEIQTNGIQFCNGKIGKDVLERWWARGLTVVSISMVHHDPDRNSEFMSPKRPYDFWQAVDILHEVGLSVRINCTMVKGGMDNWDTMKALIDLCRGRNVEQLTFRDVAKPDGCGNEIAQWTDEHRLGETLERPRRGYEILRANIEKDGGVPVLILGHGAIVYDYHGQNVCVNNCLTENTDPNEIRQLIFFPNGGLFYSWNYQGARIL